MGLDLIVTYTVRILETSRSPPLKIVVSPRLGICPDTARNRQGTGTSGSWDYHTGSRVSPRGGGRREKKLVVEYEQSPEPPLPNRRLRVSHRLFEI